MNVFHCEVLNVLNARGKDDWTPGEVLSHIESMRSDFPDTLTIRTTREALRALFKDDKVTRTDLGRNRRGEFKGYTYRTAQPKRITFKEAICDIRTALELGPIQLFIGAFMTVGGGLLFCSVAVLDMIIWLVNWIF